MKRNAMTRNLLRSIRASAGRYIAIVAIIALGSAMFVGLLMTKTDMVETGQRYARAQNMFDLRLAASYGWTQEDVDRAGALDGVAEAEGVLYRDVTVYTDSSEEESVYRFYGLPECIDRVSLRGGRMPERPDECLADGYFVGDEALGTTVTVAMSNDTETLDSLKYRTFTVVGYCASALYFDMNRGTTSVGNGALSRFVYVPREAFDTEIYSEIHLTLPEEYAMYSEEYDAAMEALAERIEPQVEEMAQERYNSILQEAEDAYGEGLAEYEDGVRQYLEGRAEAEDSLRAAYGQLKDGEAAIAANERALRQGEAELAAGREALEEAQSELDAGRAELEATKAELMATVDEILLPLTGQVTELEAQAAELNGRIAQAQAELAGLAPDSPEYAQAWVELQTLTAEQAVLSASLEAAQSALDTAQSVVAELEAQFAPMEAQIAAGEAQIEASRAQLDQAEQEIASGKRQLSQARAELAQGWDDYEAGKLEAQTELSDARTQLLDAGQELAEARREIDGLPENHLFILDRNSNIGYNSLESGSDIVQGVARVFPAFFLLVAALVCITTMTRMIDEERTQIGTLKALGYSNGAIISKYLIYAGSGAVLGCGLGVFIGSGLFPMILWDAYKIMLYITEDAVLVIDWGLCAAVVLAYTAVMLLVTWYCCHRALEEEPAALIRPKAPDPGKKLLLERLPLWRRLRFLNKVTLRNIFRYRQRLAMMLVGIGGCTALLVTGFGLRDSIVNIVDFQFDSITVYDMSVNFTKGQSLEAQAEFFGKMDPVTENAAFYHQSSIELEKDRQVKEIYLICGDERITDFIRMHDGDIPIDMPENGEAVLSVGVCEALGIRVGDRVTLRDSQLRTMDVTVSGIYDNHVYNYAIISPETMKTQWEEDPELQMAFLRLRDGEDAHAVSAEISAMEGVMNVSVIDDLALMVRNLMKALDMVVVVAVVCAALLAAIVLYNLTNININERIREIATIKVLGFRAGETAAYVFKENLILTAIGSVLGLGMGYWLLQFVMTQIRLDMVWFQAVVMKDSYFWALAITALSACIVDLIFYFKLDRINMAEALKSVE